MAIPAAVLATFAAQEAAGVLGAAADIFSDGEAEYIKNGQPEGIIPAVGQALARNACRRYAAGNTPLSAEGQARMEKACRPYLDGLGLGGGPAINQPFTGGQCVAAYTIRSGPYTVNFYSCSTGELVSSGAGVERGRASSLGPFNWIRPVVVNPGTCGSGQIVLQAQRADGFIYQVGSLALAPSGQRAEVVGLKPTVTRDDGLPDDCGSVPPEVTTPTLPPAPPSSPERFNPGPGIDINIDTSFNIDGSINFEIGTGPITIDPFGGGGGDGGGDGGGGGAPPGDVGDPGTPVDTDANGDAAGEAPAGSVLTGLKVNILAGTERLDKYTETVRRGVGYFYMGVPGLLDQDFGGSMIEDGQFLFAEKDNLTAWKARARFGVTLRVTPYYRSVA